MSLAVWDHTVLPATRHKRTHPAFTPARQAGIYSICRPFKGGLLSTVLVLFKYLYYQKPAGLNLLRRRVMVVVVVVVVAVIVVVIVVVVVVV